MDWNNFSVGAKPKDPDDDAAKTLVLSTTSDDGNTVKDFDVAQPIKANDWSDYTNVLAYARFIRAFKFLAYSNEVGETLRFSFPYLVAPCYALSFGYIFADTYHHMHPFVDQHGWSHPISHAELAKRSFWHLTASLFFPTLTIGGLIKSAKWSMIKMRASVRLIRWTLPLLGVGAIPLVIEPIDDFCGETLMPPVSAWIDGFFLASFETKSDKEIKE